MASYLDTAGCGLSGGYDCNASSVINGGSALKRGLLRLEQRANQSAAGSGQWSVGRDLFQRARKVHRFHHSSKKSELEIPINTMRAAESINLIFFSFFTVFSWLRPIARPKRVEVHLIAVVGITLVVAAQFARQFVPPFTADVIRDWLPALLLPMMYWQAGRCAATVNKNFQDRLQQIDDKLLAPWISNLATHRGYKWFAATLEVAYLSCYVLVPMGLAVLYLAQMQNRSDDYWLVILPATYACYVFTACVPTLPPRRVKVDAVTPVNGNMRTLNLWFVKHVTTELNTFPSAHVTSTLGASLLLLELVPSVGWVFVLFSIGIALGAALGRYHYAADVVVGAALAVAVYGVHSVVR